MENEIEALKDDADAALADLDDLVANEPYQKDDEGNYTEDYLAWTEKHEAAAETYQILLDRIAEKTNQLDKAMANNDDNNNIN